MDSDGELSVDGVLLDYWARVRDPPTRMGSCSVLSLGSTPQATCTIHNGTTEIQWTAILRDESGGVIDHQSGNLLANTTLSTINLSGASWNPGPGEHTLKATLLDGNGAVIAESTRTVMVQDTNWNLGITAVELRESAGKQEIVVSITRQNQSKLSDASCYVHLTDGNWESLHRVDISGDLAPQITIERPDLPVGTTVDIELKCDPPWNEDNIDSDDTNFIVLPAGIAAPSDGLDYAMLLGSLVVVFFAMGLLGLIRPDSGQRRVETRKRIRKRTPAKSKKSRPIPVDEDEDVHIEGGDESDIQADEPLIDVQPEPEELEDGADEVPVSLDDFESRLQRLRDHRERHGGN